MSISGAAYWLVILSCGAHFVAMAMELRAAEFVSRRLAGMDLKVLANGGQPEIAKGIETLIWNQGVYNGFLATGLLLSFWQAPTPAWHAQLFFSACILTAGIFGGLTVNKKLFVQAVLGGVTLLAVAFAAPDVATAAAPAG